MLSHTKFAEILLKKWSKKDDARRMDEDLILKVCGMRDPNNIQQLRDLGVDWIGMLFYDQSLRFVEEPIVSTMTEGMRRVGVFVNPSMEQVVQTIQDYKLELVQLHGDEKSDFCSHVGDLGVKVIKAFNVDLDFDFTITELYTTSVDYFLFDAKGDLLGGNGKTFDWSVLEKYQGDIPFLLSGGIDLEHAGLLKSYTHPHWAGIDINSRFELSPAVKDIEKIKQFKHELFSRP